MPKKTASVLRRIPGNPEWAVEDFPIEATGFDVDELQAMAGGNCLFEAIALDENYRIVWDEEGRLKALPVCLGLKLEDGTSFPVFGPFAVVGVRASAKQGGTIEYCGLEPEELDIVQTKFPWVTV